MNSRVNMLQVVIVILGIGFSSFSVYAQGSPNVTLLDQLDEHAVGYNDCWGYTAGGREYALLGVVNGTSIIDITDSGNATEITFIPGPSSTWKDLKTYQNYAYVVNESSGGMQVIDLSDLPNSASLDNITIDEAAGMLYAEGSGSQGVRTISLADPVNPVQISSFGISSHDMQAQNNLVYVAEGNNGSIGIFDLSTPTSPSLVARFQIANAGFVHNVWASADDNLVMTTEETTNKTVKVYDIQNPNNAILKGEYLAPSNLAHNTHLLGNYAYISHYADGLRVVDISNPSSLIETAYYDTHPATGGFSGAWGAFPFFPSGKVIISDVSNGLFVFDVDESASSGISITVTPQNPPVVIPASGGFVNFDVTINNTTGSEWIGEYWNTVTIAGGEEVGPVGGLSPFSVTIANGGTFNTSLSLEVPSGVPPASYPFNWKAGDFANRVLAVDTFTFTKSVAPGQLGKSSEHPVDWETVWNTEDRGQEALEVVPEEFVLEQNYPNPFNPTTTISYQLPTAEKVRITIYDLSGRKVRELLNENRAAGAYSAEWDGKNQVGQQVSSGVYVYQINAGQFSQSRKMVFVK